jgi:methyl-accepting chemotaxis protein
MSIRSWPIRTLFPLMAASILVSALVTAGGATLAAGQANDARVAVNNRVEARSDVAQITFLDQRIQFNSLLKNLLPSAAAAAGPAIEADLASIQATSAHLASLRLSSAELASASAVESSFGAFATYLKSLSATPVPTTPEGLAKVSATYNGYVVANAAATAAAQKLLGAGLDKQERLLTGAVRSSKLLVLGLCLLTGLLISASILIIGRQINRRLGVLGTALQALAGGDLTVQVPVGGQLELAQIAGNVNAVVAQFSKAFVLLGATSSRLGGAATHLESLAAEVGRSAEETSAQAEVVARTADEVSQNVQAVAAGGEEMGSSIGEIARNANEAARVATGAVAAVESTTGTMSKLGDSSREIGDVVRLITSIAEQTNLLALNATIEAARAGDAGKGFAVVADEVKQLAQETARATEDISRRVETIQLDAEQAAQAISAVAGVITRINEFQTTIASAVEEQTATTQAINAGVSDAATGSGQIARSISGVAGAAGATAQSMGRAHESARELSGMSDELAALVSGFRLSK